MGFSDIVGFVRDYSGGAVLMTIPHSIMGLVSVFQDIVKQCPMPAAQFILLCQPLYPVPGAMSNALRRSWKVAAWHRAVP